MKKLQPVKFDPDDVKWAKSFVRKKSNDYKGFSHYIRSLLKADMVIQKRK